RLREFLLLPLVLGVPLLQRNLLEHLFSYEVRSRNSSLELFCRVVICLFICGLPPQIYLTETFRIVRMLIPETPLVFPCTIVQIALFILAFPFPVTKLLSDLRSHRYG